MAPHPRHLSTARPRGPGGEELREVRRLAAAAIEVDLGAAAEAVGSCGADRGTASTAAAMPAARERSLWPVFRHRGG